MLTIKLTGASPKLMRATALALQAYADSFEEGDKRFERKPTPDLPPGQPHIDDRAEIEAPDEDHAPCIEDHADVEETETPPGDVDGVAHDPKYCANAADPFYKSGKRKGQWKRAHGISEAVYDRWHQRCATPDDTVVDTGAAFNQDLPAGPGTPVPQNAGDFMLWISEQMAAGLLTQEKVDWAHATAGTTVPMLFDPDVKKVQGHVTTLFGLLSA